MTNVRVAMWVWYRGDRFRGFQAQPEGDTAQQALEQALREAGLSGKPTPAGRTDRGVHARMQVVSFKAPADRLEGLAERVTAGAEPGLGVCLARQAHRSFHAQWRAGGKEYRYRLALGRTPAGWAHASWRIADDPRFVAPIAPERLDGLLQRAVGTRDFWAFHEKSSTRGPRTLREVTLRELGGGLLEVRFVGDRFARYQVRYLVGTAVAVAAGALPEEAYVLALETAAPIRGHRAPGTGLTLWEVHYPPEVDPFTEAERAAPPGLPAEPPFVSR